MKQIVMSSLRELASVELQLLLWTQNDGSESHTIEEAMNELLYDSAFRYFFDKDGMAFNTSIDQKIWDLEIEYNRLQAPMNRRESILSDEMSAFRGKASSILTALEKYEA